MLKGETKKEKRLKRNLEKIAKQKEKSVRLSSSVEIHDKYIRSSYKPDLTKTPRFAVPENYKKHYFSWCSTQSDIVGKWEWDEERLWSEDEYTNTIFSHLNSHNNNSWSEVESKTYNGRYGFRKLLNKYQQLDTICDEAQIRWMDLEFLSQFEELFRFRLGTDKRIWFVFNITSLWCGMSVIIKYAHPVRRLK